MKNARTTLWQSTVPLGLCLAAASACGSGASDAPSNPGAAGASGSSPAGMAGAGSSGGQAPSSAAGTAGAATAGSSASGSTGVSGGGSLGGSPGSAGNGGQAGGVATAGAGGGAATAHFSFFVTSLEAIIRESKSQTGFGGNLGGLAGADAICTRIAEAAMPGSGAKGWKAFLSTTTVNAIERIGSGPWYDRNDKLLASDAAGLLQERPAGNTTVNDLPNELGVPNRAGSGTGMDDNHDTITGSDT